MITNSKRRFFRFSLAGVLCFFCSTVVYDLEEIGLTTTILAVAGILAFVGCILMFKAFESLSYPDEYDHPNQDYPGTSYAPLFYGTALTTFLAVVFLLVWIVRMRAPNLQEQGVLGFCLFVIGGCLLIGRSSQTA